MLYSYAGKNKEDAPFSRYGYESIRKRTVPQPVGEVEEEGEDDDSAVEISMDDMTLAQEMNFEIVNADDGMNVRTKEVIYLLFFCS